MPIQDGRIARLAAIAAVLFIALVAQQVRAADESPAWYRDREDGTSTSLPGTYVQSHQLLVYPFYEYTINQDQEYKPSELGYGLESDFRARRTDHEALIFLSYGFTDRIAVEFESALHATATQHKAADDPSGMPGQLSESGFGDTQAELRWRWAKETAQRPEFFSYFEVVFPLQKNRVLIGTQDWELDQAFGLIKGTKCGTFSARVSTSYSGADGQVVFGEYAVEYLKRASPLWRWVLTLEGEQDEIAFIGEAQIHLRPNLFIKLNNGFGLTNKAPEMAPEVGVVFSFK
ncbi:MAG: hypothetical protein HYR73_09040 [Candidatus Eisenbacteria bacterium]|nr:hypothetical protein [Candidatus Eisenbacteria bacterium]